MNAKVIPIDTAKLKTNLDYALAYAAIGWPIFPLWWIDKPGNCACGKCDEKSNSRGKHPLTAKGQNEATTNHDIIKSWWGRYPHANIGIYLAGAGLVAIDIDPRNGGMDSIEQLEDIHGKIESDVLQFTGGGGEHRVFYVPDGVHNLPGKLGAGIDLKRNGYIVAEPSAHFSGGSYEWEASSNPLNGVAPSPLPDWIRDLSTQSTQETSSNDIISRLVTKTQAEELRSSLKFIDADDRETWIDVGHALKTIGAIGWNLWYEYSIKSDLFNYVDALRVWRSFKPKSLNIETIFFMARKNGWPGYFPCMDVSELMSNDTSINNLKHSKSNHKFSYDYDVNLPIPVKKLNEFSSYLDGLFETPTPAISKAGSIAFGSVLTGRLYRSEKANWTSLLIAVLGSSGVGKNYIKVGIERSLIKAGLESLVSGDFYTHQSAVYSELKKKPTHICISDEFGENFYEARKSDNSNKLTVFKSFKKAYSDADHIYKAESYSNMTNKKIDTTPIICPSLTLLGLATPMQFYSEIKAHHIESGLINRFIIVNVNNGDQVQHHLGSHDPSPDLIDWIKDVRRYGSLKLETFDSYPSYTEVKFSPASLILFEDAKHVQNTIADSLEDEHLDALPRRWRESSMRLATMLAACDNCSHPVITEEIAYFAIHYVFGNGLITLDKIRTGVGENDYHVSMNALLNFIKLNPKCSNEDLSRKFRSLKQKERNEMLQHLFDGQLIINESTSATGISGKGRNKVLWSAI